MSTRSALFLASAALIAASSPVLAQDGRYGSHPDGDMPVEWQHREVVQQWNDEDYAADAEVDADAVYEGDYRERDRHTAEQAK